MVYYQLVFTVGEGTVGSEHVYVWPPIRELVNAAGAGAQNTFVTEAKNHAIVQ